ncbi:cache domain-containing sensor histidine kinase [Paenibacillus prosopidis]|uniref:Two-component system sensor histidine kinase YesM n=1 Tax=Paenibacillus prosopidis TaxID=630520 RepID=A0A368VZT4_9BACL|nr:sensor histidine kinase [Paenibacillus prosopidis]RCW47525.1 two-component system sensor histidine kinase YesM [Paenibacillus prosopidis]
MKTIHTFFIKNFVSVILPMFIPILVLGGLFNLIIENYIKDAIVANNSSMLRQAKDNVELIFNELDAISLYFITNPTINHNMNRVLRSPVLESGDITLFDTVRDFIDAPANARPYIDSIYMYIPNDYGRYYNSKNGIDYLSTSHDVSWRQSIDLHENDMMWAESRTVKEFSFQPPNKVITLYRKLSQVPNSGVLILNISTDYIEKQLDHLKVLPEQQIFILDQNNQLMTSRTQLVDFTNKQFEEIALNKESFFTIRSANDPSLVSKLHSDKYGWSFVMVTSQESLYKVPNYLTKLTFFLLIACFIAGTLLAYILTRNNYRNVKSILNIIHSAKYGTELSLVEEKPYNVYNYIIQNVLRTFVEHNYLTVQLSERKYRNEVLELKTLQAQINPHFLFNTLQTIYWKVISLTGKPNEANVMLEHLSDILKYALDVPIQLIRLEEELQYTRSYIEILKYRYSDKFKVIWDLEEDLLDYRVNKLILQPLVENALYHGIKNKKDPGIIKIRIRAKGRKLLIAVIDNGIGISPDHLKQIRDRLQFSSANADEDQPHIGLYNTYKRIKIQFGTDSRFIIKAKERFGTKIEITLPLFDHETVGYFSK